MINKYSQLLYKFASANPYSVLGVNKNSSQKEIKNSYHKLAKKYHPDVCKDKDGQTKFAEINNAYETLGDEKKRQMYDQTGFTSDEQMQGGFGGAGGGFGDFNHEDIFSQFFNQGGSRSQQRQQVEPIQSQINITFMESVKGVNKTIKFSRQKSCSTCSGSGAKPGTKAEKCVSCDGKGMKHQKVPGQAGLYMQTQCSACQGEGQVIKNKCNSCRGTGQQSEIKEEVIQIPAGVQSDQTLQVKGMGHQLKGMTGDLVIHIDVASDQYFTRGTGNDINDIYSNQTLSVTQCVLGDSIEVETVHGKIKTQIQPGAQHGDKITLSGRGVQGRQGQSGNHIINIKIQIPKKITKDQKELFSRLNESLEKPDKTANKLENQHQRQGRGNGNGSRKRSKDRQEDMQCQQN